MFQYHTLYKLTYLLTYYSSFLTGQRLPGKLGRRQSTTDNRVWRATDYQWWWGRSTGI